MRVLVCGGAGYIGSNMTALLAAQGHQPLVLDNFRQGHRSAVRNFEVVQADLADYPLLVQTLKDRMIEAVMHFAASIDVAESLRRPLTYYRNNLSNTQNLLSAMEAAAIEKFVFSSTAAVYGAPERPLVTEDSPTRPINPYGQTKLAVEEMCHYQSKTGRLRYAALRYFNACGAGSNASLGEDHRPESHLIPLIIQAAMGKRPDIKIYGTDYPTPDGTCIRDYVHVDDLCRAHLLALDKLDGSTELTYNLGNGAGYSVRQVIETVARVSGRDVKVVDAPRRPGDPAVLTCNADKARTELLWKPTTPELDAMIETAWRWHNSHREGYPD